MSDKTIGQAAGARALSCAIVSRPVILRRMKEPTSETPLQRAIRESNEQEAAKRAVIEAEAKAAAEAAAEGMAALRSRTAPPENKRLQLVLDLESRRKKRSGSAVWRPCLAAKTRTPRIHAIGLHHTITDERFSHCAFTGKILRFPKVAPYPVIEYSNGVSKSGAEQVRIFTEKQLIRTFGPKLFTHTTWENVNHAQNRETFLSTVRAKMASRVRPGDIVAHTCGAEASLVAAFPEALHVETGIGYAAGPAGCYRIFESESWRAWHMGRYHVPNSSGTWPHYPEITTTAVCPNYYDPEDWGLGSGNHHGPPYVLYAGRMTSDKGIEIVESCARAFPETRFLVVSGDPRSDRLTAPNIQWVGRVEKRKDMAAMYGSATCVLMPSRFWEPFGGVAVESLLCGTPVICPDYAAFTETVAHPDDGLRCVTTDDYELALKLMLEPAEGWTSHAGRESRRTRAQERFGIKTVRAAYAAAFGQFERLRAQGVKPL